MMPPTGVWGLNLKIVGSVLAGKTNCIFHPSVYTAVEFDVTLQWQGKLLLYRKSIINLCKTFLMYLPACS